MSSSEDGALNPAVTVR